MARIDEKDLDPIVARVVARLLEASGFDDPTLEAAFERSGGRCECQRTSCGHGGRCSEEFDYEDRGGSGEPGAWQAHHRRSRDSGGDSNLENSEILCIECHKNTGSYGRGSP